MILVGIIPGPSKPRGEAIQNFIKPLVDELVVLWSDGVYVQRTCKYPLGRLCRVALGPLICDLDAVRSIVGMAGVSFRHPCSVCWVTMKEVREWSTDLVSWKWRTKSEHLLHVSAHRDASTQADRDNQFKLIGIKGCELLRLSYWHPLDWVTIDPMHNLLLGIMANHLTEIFGLKSNSQGRRLLQPAADPDDPGDASFGYLVFLRDSLQVKELQKLKVKVLLNLSVRLGVLTAEEAARSKSTKSQLSGALYALKSSPNCPNSPPTAEDLALAVKWLVRSTPADKLHLLKRTDLRMIADRIQPGADHSKLTSNSLAAIIRTLVPLTTNPVLPRGQTGFEHAILNEAILAEIKADRNATIMPSWLAKGPENFGAAAHGTLSANETRVSGTVHVPLTLIRLWGLKQRSSTKAIRLRNFLHLVEAVDLALRHTTSPTRWTAIGNYLVYYMQRARELYPSISGKPNNHLALHQPEMLKAFGPSRAWWAFPMERWNGILQSLPTNHRIGGELEYSMLTRFVRRSWMTCKVAEHTLPEGLKEAAPALLAFANPEFSYKGTLLQDNCSSTVGAWSITPWKENLRVYGQFEDLLRAAAPSLDQWFRVRSIRRESHVYEGSTMQWQKHPTLAARNSLVLCRIDNGYTPAVIRLLSSHQVEATEISTLLIVQTFTPFNSPSNDPYRKMHQALTRNGADPHQRFYLMSATLNSTLHVIRPSDIVSHTAYTPYRCDDTIPAAVFTVLQRT